MDIIKYDPNMPKEQLAKFAASYKREFPNNKFIFIPQNFDVIADANHDTLMQVRDNLLNVIDYIDEEVNKSPDEEKKGVSQEVVDDFLKSKGFTHSWSTVNKKQLVYYHPHSRINCKVDLENNSFTLSFSPDLTLAQLTLESCSPLIDPPDKSYNQFDRMYRQFLHLVQRLNYGN